MPRQIAKRTVAVPAPRQRLGWRRRLAGLSQLFGLDLRSLALLRISLGLLTIADTVDRARDLRAHYTDFGLLPRAPLLSRFMNDQAVCLHVITGTTLGMALLFGLQACVGALLLLGWRTRLMSILAWALMVSLHLRNPMVLQGGDDLLRMLLFWSMFLPLGACYSMDSALADVPQERPLAHPLCNAATVAMVGQVLLMYWSTAILKTGAEWHREGSAVYYALSFDQLVLPLGLWLRQFYPVTVFLTHLTMLWETMGPFLLITPLWFGPLRTLALTLFIAMHHSFSLCLMLGLFPWIDMASMVMLLPAWFWLKVGALLRRDTQHVTIYFDGDCDFCRKLALVIREFLLLRDVPVVAASQVSAVAALMQEKHSWVVADKAGLYTEFSAYLALCAVSPVAWPWIYVGRWPWAKTMGDQVYRWVARHRGLGSRFTARFLPYGRTAPTLRLLPLWQAVVVGLFALIVLWNTASWPGSRLRYPDVLRALAYALRIDQDWGMFAPYPQKEDGWYVVAGRLEDGREVEVYTHRIGPLSWEKPAVVSDYYANQRWSKYMMNIWLSRNADYRLYFGQYLCRTWNGTSNKRGPEKLNNFEIVYMKEMNLAGYQTSSPERVVVWKHYCFEVPKNPI